MYWVAKLSVTAAASSALGLRALITTTRVGSTALTSTDSSSSAVSTSRSSSSITRSAIAAESTSCARVDTSVGSMRPSVDSLVVGSMRSRVSAAYIVSARKLRP